MNFTVKENQLVEAIATNGCFMATVKSTMSTGVVSSKDITNVVLGASDVFTKQGVKYASEQMTPCRSLVSAARSQVKALCADGEGFILSKNLPTAKKIIAETSLKIQDEIKFIEPNYENLVQCALDEIAISLDGKCSAEEKQQILLEVKGKIPSFAEFKDKCSISLSLIPIATVAMPGIEEEIKILVNESIESNAKNCFQAVIVHALKEGAKIFGSAKEQVETKILIEPKTAKALLKTAEKIADNNFLGFDALEEISEYLRLAGNAALFKNYPEAVLALDEFALCARALANSLGEEIPEMGSITSLTQGVASA